MAFEIKWEDICGLNYHNPLCNDGRVVIEAANLTKRQFLTVCNPGQACCTLVWSTGHSTMLSCLQMKEAQKYYLKRVSTPEPQSPALRRHGAHTLRTYASSPNMSLPLITRTTTTSRATHGAHAQHQHVQWQPDNKQQGPAASAQPSAMRSLEPALPSMPETSAASQVPAPAVAEECTPDSPEHHAAHRRHDLHNGQAGTRTCLKHAGIGTTSPPQAREAASALTAALEGCSQVPTAYLQASSMQGSVEQNSSQAASASEPAAGLVSAFSGASLVQDEEEQLRRQSGSSKHGVGEQWPETCSWTVPCHVYKYRTVTFNFRDPSLPGVLQPAINVSPACFFCVECVSSASIGV